MKWVHENPTDDGGFHRLRSDDDMFSYAEIYVHGETNDSYPHLEAYIYLTPERPRRSKRCVVQYDSLEEGMADLEKTMKEMWLNA